MSNVDKISAKPPLKIEDIVSKVVVFLVCSSITFLIVALIISGLIELDIIKDTETTTIILLSITFLLSAFVGYKVSIKRNYKNTFQKVVASGLLSYLAELVMPMILTSLFYILLEAKDIYEKDGVAILFGFLFFFTVILEWVRRKKDNSNRPYYFKFLYIGLMLIIFLLGILYANQLPEY